MFPKGREVKLYRGRPLAELTRRDYYDIILDENDMPPDILWRHDVPLTRGERTSAILEISRRMHDINGPIYMLREGIE